VGKDYLHHALMEHAGHCQTVRDINKTPTLKTKVMHWHAMH